MARGFAGKEVLHTAGDDEIAAYGQSRWREYYNSGRGVLGTGAEKARWWVFDEDSTWRVVWDVVSVMFAAVLVVLEPWIAAFDPRSLGFGLRRSRRHSLWVVIVDSVNLLWFGLDMLLSMTTTYRGLHGVKVWEPRQIVDRYMKSFFLWDLWSTVPWDRLFAKRLCRKRCARKGSAITLVHMIPIARAFRGSKIRRARELKNRFMLDPSDVVGLPPSADHLARFVVSAFFGVHIAACIWFIIGDKSKSKGLDQECYEGLAWDRRGKASQCTWLQKAGYSKRMTRGFLYTTCLYWAVTTVTTVGYGDISATTVGEKLFAIFVEVCGVAWFGLLISALGSDVLSDSRAEEARQLKSALKKFLWRHHFPPALALAVSSYVRNQFEVEREFDGDDPDVSRLLRNSLNEPLKRRVALHMASRDPAIATNALFMGRGRSPPVARRSVFRRPSFAPFQWGRDVDFVADLVLKMKTSIAGPRELVVPSGTKAQGLFIVILGRVEAIDEDDDPALVVDSGDYFGDEAVLCAATWALPVFTPRCYCEFNLVDGHELHDIFVTHVAIADALRIEARDRIAKHPQVFTIDDDAQPHASTTSFSACDEIRLLPQLEGIERQLAEVTSSLQVLRRKASIDT